MSLLRVAVLDVADFVVAVRVVAVRVVAVRIVPKLVVAALVVAVLAVAAVGAKAEPSGYPGRTSTISGGCGDCHGNNASSATTVSLQAGAPTTVLPGSTTMFTIVVAHATQRLAGVGIAVRTTPTGTTAAGSLAVISGQITRLRSGEITHSSPKAMSGGQVTYSFNWTAPTQEGTYYIQAVGNACNGNGRDDDSDTWAFMQPVAITVSSTNDVDESEPQAPYQFQIAPNPLVSGVAAMLHGVPAGARHLSIVSANGMVVFERDVTGEASDQPAEIPSLPSGTYAVLVSTRTGMVSVPLMVVR